MKNAIIVRCIIGTKNVLWLTLLTHRESIGYWITYWRYNIWLSEFWRRDGLRVFPFCLHPGRALIHITHLESTNLKPIDWFFLTLFSLCSCRATKGPNVDGLPFQKNIPDTGSTPLLLQFLYLYLDWKHGIPLLLYRMYPNFTQLQNVKWTK